MLQRYVLPHQRAAEHEFMPQQAWWKFRASFNVSPHQFVPCVRACEERTEASMMGWGLIPAGAEDAAAAVRPARVSRDEIDTQPGVREAWKRSRRCILPAAGFYVWRPTPVGYRQPYFIRLADRTVFGIAGVWDCWSDRTGDVIETCCAITVPANGFIRALHPAESSMPAILRRRDYAAWLSGRDSAARGALRAFDAAELEAYPVSPRVNSPRAEGSALIKPVRLMI